jgi:hypothetical protein
MAIISHGHLLLLTLLALGDFRWSPNKGKKVLPSHVGAQDFGNDNSLGSLVGLQQTANTSTGSTESGVQNMTVSSPSRQVLLYASLATASDADSTCLIIRTIAATDQFTVGSLPGEPSFQIILFDGRIVEFATDQTDDTVSESQGFVEFLSSFQHFLLFRLGFFEIVLGQTELFNLFKLMDSEDSANILSRRTSLFTEAGRNTGVSNRQGALLDPFVLVVGTNGLFGGGNQILSGTSIWIIGLTRDFVELFVKIIQLRNAGHITSLFIKKGGCKTL